MDAFLRALQGGQLPAGTRRELDARFGAQVTDDLIAAGLLVPGPRAVHYPCPRLGSACPRDVIENVGDPRQAEVYASWAMFVFVGYEQSTLPRENPVFAWISNRMLDDLAAGRFTDVPPPSSSATPAHQQ